MSIRFAHAAGVTLALLSFVPHARAQQAAPWETPAAEPAPVAAPAPATAAPVAEAKMAPGWLVRVHPRDGESLTELNAGVIRTYTSADGAVHGNTHLALVKGNNLYMPVVYEGSGELNITTEGDYTFRLHVRQDANPHYVDTVYSKLCGLSLNIQGQPVIAAKNFPYDFVVDRKPMGTDVASSVVHLPAGRYPASWTVSCGDEKGIAERERYQRGATEIYDITTQLQVSTDGTNFDPLPEGMALHDAALELPLEAPKQTLERPAALQPGYVHGWSVEVYSERGREIPASSAMTTDRIGKGVVTTAELTNTAMIPLVKQQELVGKGMLANFTAKSNLLIKQDGHYTLMLKVSGGGNFYGTKNCRVSMTAGQAGTVFDEPLVFNKASSMAVGNGLDLTAGAYPLALAVACSQPDGGITNPLVDFTLMVVRPGENLPQPVALNDLVTEAAQ